MWLNYQSLSVIAFKKDLVFVRTASSSGSLVILSITFPAMVVWAYVIEKENCKAKIILMNIILFIKTISALVKFRRLLFKRMLLSSFRYEVIQSMDCSRRRVYHLRPVCCGWSK